MPKIRMERTQYNLISKGVQEDEQTLSISKPFWVFFVGNIGIATWLIGVLVAGMGLNFSDSLFVLFFGSILGSIVPAAVAILGPLTRLSQLEMGRLSLGRTGKKIPAFCSWVSAIGWDIINNIVSTAALVALLAMVGVTMPFWVGLAILVGIQMLAGIYGHHLIQDMSKYSGALMGILFILIGIIAMHKTSLAPIADKHLAVKDIFSAISLLAVCNISWALAGTDYTRYLPAKTPSRQIFLSVFAALFLSLFLPAFFGYMTASAVTEQTPEGVMRALQGLSGHFAPLVLFLVAFGAIPANAINDNSGAYSLASAGLKWSRPTLAALGAILGYVICLFASNSFVDFFENFLFLFAHGIAPWAAIILVHWFTIGRKEQVAPSGITRGCIIFVGVTAASIFLFSANTLYTGFLSSAVGGVDVGPFIGFMTAAVIYYATLRLWPVKYKTVSASALSEN